MGAGRKETHSLREGESKSEIIVMNTMYYIIISLHTANGLRLFPSLCVRSYPRMCDRLNEKKNTLPRYCESEWAQALKKREGGGNTLSALECD